MEPIMNKKSTVVINSFLKVIDMMTELKIRYWVESGWGIDVLIGKQTREHRDIGIDFDADYEDLLISKLESIGYRITTDLRPTRAELYHPTHGYIDIHPFVIGENGDIKQAIPEGASAWPSSSAAWAC